MDRFNLPTSIHGRWLPERQSDISHLVFNTIFVVGLIGILLTISRIVFKLLKWIINFFRPLDYKLLGQTLTLKKLLDHLNQDMTTKEFCKYLAEVDNDLRRHRQQQQQTVDVERATGRSNESSTDSNLADQSQSTLPVDCATDLPGNACNGQQMIVTNASINNNNNDNNNNSDNNIDDKSSVSRHRIKARGSVDNFGSTDHVYPNGWFPLVESSKVKPGSIKKAIFMGRDLIITRSIEGEVNVLDAYCPHMGVHIGVGGRVIRVNNESCVQCPFHGWTFRASDGQCTRIPYLKNQSSSNSTNKSNTTETIAKQAKLAIWSCIEVDNFVYIWHHIDNEPPNWFPTPTEELTDVNKKSGWVLAGRSCHKTNLEIRDVLENGADMNHFEGIHNDLFLFGGEILKVQAFSHLQKYFRHHWSPEWKPIVDDDGKVTHKAEMSLLSWITVFKMRLFDIQVYAVQVGPARVILRYDSKWYGKGILTMNAVPLGGRRTLYYQHIYTERALFSWFMARWVLYGEILQLERDLFIWNHKKNVNPIFVQEDKVLKRFRMWYSQFYRRKRKITIRDRPETDHSQPTRDHKRPCSQELEF